MLWIFSPNDKLSTRREVEVSQVKCEESNDCTSCDCNGLRT